ncbi:HXXEE domain-containing protein [Rhodoplanes elegans]|uniref:HXXEE domain-containing protein n=1 Tax=Rhodoplanes elegans TaxID=29408 RepID=A0A327KJT3_9BRAD|nr:HXXEE domain-containing protein [Rhodoplanes elegans]MBK5959415.1 HXXEE domain-containing protein [Rhodoplanes elegans]RAI37823.1 HXXEE domain-containing protein [Rhodoplanes elegans]
MTLVELSWLAMAAYAVHILEEYTFDWRDWARGVIGLPVEWTDFYVTNAVVVALGMAQGMLAPTLPWAPLTYAALMIINAVFFHILPFVTTRGRFSPGLVTAVVLFLPLGIAMFAAASSEGRLDLATSIGAAVGGALLMASPVVMLKLKDKPWFVQRR